MLGATLLGCDVEIAPVTETDSMTEEASGRLPPKEIQRIIRSDFSRMRVCYDEGLAKRPGLAGSVKLGFVIDRQGEVHDIEDRGSTLPDAEVVACVARIFEGMSFPEPSGGEVKVIYPIVFGVD